MYLRRTINNCYITTADKAPIIFLPIAKSPRKFVTLAKIQTASQIVGFGPACDFGSKFLPFFCVWEGGGMWGGKGGSMLFFDCAAVFAPAFAHKPKLNLRRTATPTNTTKTSPSLNQRFEIRCGNSSLS